MTGADGDLAGLRLLLVEDEYLVARDIRRTLLAAGCAEVELAATLRDGQRRASTGGLDGALLDIKLGDADAFPLAEHLLETGVPLLFITGYSGDSIPKRLQGVVRLDKPFPRRQLVHAVRCAIAGKPER